MIVLFGLPGSGKSFVGNVLQKYFDYYHHDGDVDLPDEMRKAIQNKGLVTDLMRDMFFQNIITTVQELKKSYKHIVVSQTFIKEKYREQFLTAFPETKFIFIKTSPEIREARLTARIEYPLDIVYAQKMEGNFDPPHIAHQLLHNDKEGDAEIRQQLGILLSGK